MAVYTHLTNEQIEDLLTEYEIGTLVSAEGIVQGIDNSNFKIETTQGRYILTIFESRIEPDDIPYFLDLMAHLEESGIHSPAPIKNKREKTLASIANKPCAFFTFIDGHGVPPEKITPQICGELGTLLARMHIAGQNEKFYRTNSMGMDAWETRLRKVGDNAAPYLQELEFLKHNWPQNLPTGNIHADLFPDNVFILDGHIYGVIDFYFAATDFLAYDLAIVMNAWCFDKDWKLAPERWQALLSAYEAIRPLTQAEKDTYQIISRGAAMRFLSSRLHDLTFHDPNALVKPHDPAEYIAKLDFHRDTKLF